MPKIQILNRQINSTSPLYEGAPYSTTNDLFMPVQSPSDQSDNEEDPTNPDSGKNIDFPPFLNPLSSNKKWASGKTWHHDAEPDVV